MSFYDNKDSAAKYIDMCDGYDAANELPQLFDALPQGARILEIGSGPGNDLALLKSRYDAVGSDNSDAFINHLEARFPDTTILKLNAETLATDQRFDAIYSNKVLHHLDDVGLKRSLLAQAKLLKPRGLVFHLIWRRIETIPEDFGMVFVERELSHMRTAMGPSFELLSSVEFGEFEAGDSLAILARVTGAVR